MKKIIFLAFIVAALVMQGCFNYRELDHMAIVSTIAIDKGENNRFKLTAEITDLTSGQKEEMSKPLFVTAEGETLLQTFRNAIRISGNKLYIGHLQSIIISQDLAKDGIFHILDFFTTDAEPPLIRPLVVSRERTAAELLSVESVESNFKGFNIKSSLQNQAALSKAYSVKLLDVVNTLAEEGSAFVLPTVGSVLNNGKATLNVAGMAVFKNAKLIDFISEDDTKYLMFVHGEIKGGVLTVNDILGSGEKTISLEIFRNKTSIKPICEWNSISFEVNLETEVALDEVGSPSDYFDPDNIVKLKKEAEKELKEDTERFIKKVQKELKADIFDFGMVLKRENPKVWKQISKDWEDIFPSVKITVKPEIKIINSAIRRNPIKIGE